MSTATEPTNILLVDDVPANLVALQALLARPDYHVVLADSGAAALAEVLRRAVALIQLDVAMPQHDGLQTAASNKSPPQKR
ncbi:MAG: response regulator, partial [Kofleriaceae bacterium]